MNKLHEVKYRYSQHTTTYHHKAVSNLMAYGIMCKVCYEILDNIPVPVPGIRGYNHFKRMYMENLHDPWVAVCINVKNSSDLPQARWYLKGAV